MIDSILNINCALNTICLNLSFPEPFLLQEASEGLGIELHSSRQARPSTAFRNPRSIAQFSNHFKIIRIPSQETFPTFRGSPPVRAKSPCLTLPEPGEICFMQK